jgi:hypothetical protein
MNYHFSCLIFFVTLHLMSVYEILGAADLCHKIYKIFFSESLATLFFEVKH